MKRTYESGERIKRKNSINAQTKTEQEEQEMNILEEIAAKTGERIAQEKQQVPPEELQEKIK